MTDKVIEKYKNMLLDLPICKGVESLQNMNLKVGDPQQKNNIVVFFLSSHKKKDDNSYLSFSQALDQKLVNISEVNEKPSLSKLKITNTSNKTLLILGGETIIGHKIRQNRIVASTTLIPANATVLMSVNCGERYRWSWMVNENINTSESLYFSRRNLGKQFKIWDEIKYVSNQFRVKNFTSSVEEIYKKRKYHLHEIENFFLPQEHDIGVVIGVNNHLKSLDIFSSNLMLKIYLKKIIKSVAIKSFKKINHKSYLKTKDVHKFLRQVIESDKSEFKVDKGTLGKIKKINFSAEGESINGKILYTDNNEVIHGSFFSREPMVYGTQKDYINAA